MRVDARSALIEPPTVDERRYFVEIEQISCCGLVFPSEECLARYL
jgi:hypothetical protein